MDPHLQPPKTVLRDQIRARLREMPAATRLAESGRLCTLLQNLTVWKTARAILFFAPLPEEVDVWPLLETALATGKEVSLPCFVPETGSYSARRVCNATTDLKTGRFGIREPAENCPAIVPEQLELILVPGVAFDLRGNRLGRGRGFYDRLLAGLKGVKCGVAFDQQIVESLPSEQHDTPVDCIVTPTRWLEPRPDQSRKP